MNPKKRMRKQRNQLIARVGRKAWEKAADQASAKRRAETGSGRYTPPRLQHPS